MLRHTLSASALGLALLSSSTLVDATSTLFTGGTIVGFDVASDSIVVTRNGSLLVTDDRIAAVWGPEEKGVPVPAGASVVDITNKIVTPGFIDTHRHGWQTSFKTLGSNTTLVEYVGRYGEFASAGLWTADDVYISQLAGLYEALNGGVTTTLDHAHHTWSVETSVAGLNASIDSGARVFWAFAFHNVSGWTVPEQVPAFRDIATTGSFEGTRTSLGLAYDFFGPTPWVPEVEELLGLATEFNVSVITTHSVQGVWGFQNSPEDLQAFGALNASIPIVFSHASFLTPLGAQLLRATDQYISITPESESHYGHTNPGNHLIQDQAALGVDTHFTFSSDILTQARLWLQSVRYLLFEEVLDQWEVPSTNPMSANQAFLLATRHGGLALRRPDLGIIAPGAKADLVIWDGRSPSLLGWTDPVAAVILHASVADVEHVLVDGEFVKRNGKLTAPDYPSVQDRFLTSAARIQSVYKALPLPPQDGAWLTGFPLGKPLQVDVQRGPGTGYGPNYF